ncbi:sugar kinase [Paraglaciecola hydrolytica]|uniref:Ketodeoxygluconokinase n=1 Tax=Paraglaciecola hydrolytica TaxID=1799789 RepID=A0A136A6U2_9ALTE|nr:sugar kinase [Paraglaciecola hydrolytica]KXI30953.1 ketodeoxygluconokinase [Paraglaciecola hydrolytica]
MQKVVLFGECMLELRQSEANTMHRSFAGDVFNTAVYQKRAFAQQQVSFMTALGQDVLSQQLVDNCKAEGLNCDLVRYSTSHNPGIYLVQTDAQGERSFLYWRENSAARQAMKLLDEEVRNQVCKADVFFFSGISLAILAREDRALFWQFLNEVQKAGVTIAFDPNYRARLWESAEDARQQFALAFTASSMVLPGIEDFSVLYGLNELKDIVAFCEPFNIKELVIKNGGNSVFCRAGDFELTQAVKPVAKVVDTTSAGDSFNGVYLGARLAGYDIGQAIELAASAAGLVIQFPGAIIPNENFKALIDQQILAFEHLAK